MLNFCLYIGTKYIEVICEGYYFEILLERSFCSSNYFHGNLIIQIYKIVLLLYNISVMIWIQKDKFYVFKNNMGFWLNLSYLFFMIFHHFMRYFILI